VLDLVAGQAVEVEHRRVEFGSQDLPTLRNPPEWRARVCVRVESETVVGVCRDAPRRVRQLEHPRADPIPVCRLAHSRERLTEDFWRRAGDLVDDAVRHVRTAQLLAGDVVVGVRRPCGLYEWHLLRFPGHGDREDVADGGTGQDARHECAHVARTGDVAPAEEPATVPAVADGLVDFGLGDPVPREGFGVGVVVLDIGEPR
jgi:hypothetical protein